ncbi:hypothetical protein BLNAU_8323 [Blattamonas nauphoetae]|uniref:Poly(A) RNA polymerase mitochondrial-like central palm domain-containing protein n=1 Tax=Blattamonas nauphoetae TaxID=2049346 RepID=A0ABQ9XZ07_9EUKA|nr:hypothetical protein BLNAU_8323 [Blattamonas nauphoetae]
MSSNIPVTDHTLSISPPKQENPPSPAEQERPQPSSDTTNAPTPPRNPNTTPKNIWFPKLQMVCPRGVEEEIDGFVGQREFVANNANFSKIEMIRVALEKFVVGVLPTASGVELFGSARSTTMIPHSDLDFTIILNQEIENPEDLLGEVKDVMKEDGTFTVEEFVPAGKLTNIKCSTNMQIWDQDEGTTLQTPFLTKFDLVVENRIGMASCDLIRTYCSFDPRVRPFLLLVKRFAKAKGIAQAARQTLSCHAWNLSCLCFLQICNPPIIPNLQSEDYISASDQTLVIDRMCGESHIRFSSDMGPWQSRQAGLIPNPNSKLQSISPRPINEQSLGSIFLSYLEFLGMHYDNKMALSLKHGGLVSTESISHLIKQEHRPSRYVIVEPFEFMRNAAVSVQKTAYIKKPVTAAAKYLQAGGSFLQLISSK